MELPILPCEQAVSRLRREWAGREVERKEKCEATSVTPVLRKRPVMSGVRWWMQLRSAGAVQQVTMGWTLERRHEQLKAARDRRLGRSRSEMTFMISSSLLPDT